MIDKPCKKPKNNMFVLEVLSDIVVAYYYSSFATRFVNVAQVENAPLINIKSSISCTLLYVIFTKMRS